MTKIYISFFVISVLFIFLDSVFAQNKNAEIDSLKNVLQSTTTDTTRIIILNQNNSTYTASRALDNCKVDKF